MIPHIYSTSGVKQERSITTFRVSSLHSDPGGLMPALRMEEAYSPNSAWLLRLDRMEWKSKSLGYRVVSVRG